MNLSAGRIVEIDTPHGRARAHVNRTSRASGLVVLGHGAGGGVSTADLAAATRAANEGGFTAALIEQPYRVAGRRSQPSAAQLDSAWVAVVDRLRQDEAPESTLIVGGRSAGARVACRTAAELDADAVLCLAFPVHPPGKAGDPSKSRLRELEAVRVPVLVVQGDRDPFGRPPAGPRRQVIPVPGTHSLKSTDAVQAAIAGWLPELRGGDVPRRGSRR